MSNSPIDFSMPILVLILHVCDRPKQRPFSRFVYLVTTKQKKNKNKRKHKEKVTKTQSVKHRKRLVDIKIIHRSKTKIISQSKSNQINYNWTLLMTVYIWYSFRRYRNCAPQIAKNCAPNKAVFLVNLNQPTWNKL